MDLNFLTDPDATTNAYKALFGAKIAGWLITLQLIQSNSRIIFKPFSAKIQKFWDALVAWAHEDGNTEIHNKLEIVERKWLVKLAFFLLDFCFSIKLGSQHATTITTTTQTATATLTTKVEAPVVAEPHDPGPRP